MGYKEGLNGEILVGMNYWRSAGLWLASLAFVAIFVWDFISEGCSVDYFMSLKGIVLTLGAVFFGVGVVVIGFGLVQALINPQPAIIIGRDKVEFYAPMKREYTTIMYKDVKEFVLTRLDKQQMLGIVLTTTRAIDEVGEDKSRLHREMIALNIEKTGAEYNYATDLYNIPADELCSLLNHRLDAWRNN